MFAGAAGGAGAGATTEVGVEVALCEPFLFDAVTATRIVEPTSAFPSLYVVEVAPATRLHAFPVRSQRSHWAA